MYVVIIMGTKDRKGAKYHGSRTHGWGTHKKHRGHGNKGGSGMGGTGKRGDAKKPSIWNIKNYFGKHGFKFHGQQETYNPINLSQLDHYLDSFVKEGKATKSGEVYTIDLEKAGHNKLLGSGQIRKKVHVTVGAASEQAQSKIVEAGGKIEGLKTESKE
jgi:large subunit ribosomal protein L15